MLLEMDTYDVPGLTASVRSKLDFEYEENLEKSMLFCRTAVSFEVLSDVE